MGTHPEDAQENRFTSKSEYRRVAQRLYQVAREPMEREVRSSRRGSRLLCHVSRADLVPRPLFGNA